jgi:hypothetical protein
VEDIVSLKSCPEWGRGLIPSRGCSPSPHPGREPIRGENVSTGSAVGPGAPEPRCSTRGYRPTPLPGLASFDPSLTRRVGALTRRVSEASLHIWRERATQIRDSHGAVVERLQRSISLGGLPTQGALAPLATLRFVV